MLPRQRNKEKSDWPNGESETEPEDQLKLLQRRHDTELAEENELRLRTHAESSKAAEARMSANQRERRRERDRAIGQTASPRQSQESKGKHVCNPGVIG